VTLALVIGACTAVFSLADAILLRPLPYPDPAKLAFVERTIAGPSGIFPATFHDGATWEAVRDGVPSLDAAVLSLGGGGANLVVGESAAYVRQHRVSAGYFRVLGVAPIHGRGFSDDEDRAGGAAVTILSHDTWQRFFKSDPDIVGRPILLRGEPHTVVGVMPRSFAGIRAADLWTPLRASSTGEGGGTNFQIVARLRPDARWEQAATQLAGVRNSAFRLFRPDPTVTRTLGVKPAQDELVASTREPIVILSWAVGCVLLIACVNLAALLIARGGSRTKEIATRMALGSGRSGVIRQLMVEALVLAVAGGVLGLFVGYVGLEGLKTLGDEMYEQWDRVALDGRVLALTFGLSLATSVLFGLIPALQASRLDVNSALTASGSRAVAGGSRHWPRRLLVVAEVALGVALLVTTGLLVRTFVNLRVLEPGFEPAGLVTASVSMQDARYRTSGDVNRLFDNSLRLLRATPGIEAAAVSLELPYERLLNKGFRLVGDADGRVANVAYVSPGFFETMRIPVRRGRGVLESDSAAAPPVVVVNESFARVFSKDRDVLGRRLQTGNVEREIVGVVGNVQARPSLSIAELGDGPLVPMPIIFEPAAQTTDAELRTAHTWFSPVWTVRARSSNDAGMALRRAIAGADPLLPLSAVRSMDDVMATSTSVWRLLMTLVGALAAAAMLLAALGIHGLIAHSIAERRREFGIRLALGATPGQAARRVAAGGIMLSLAGAALGGLLSVWSVGLVQSFLWGVEPHDLMTYAGVALFLLAVAILASVIPSLRILRLDPAETLRT
jgi:putative ABC transport system permease protein